MNHYRVCESTHTCRGAHTASCHVCSVSLWHQSLTLLCLLSSCYLPPGLSDLSFSFSFLPSSRSCLSYFPSSPTFRLPIYSLHSCFASLYYVLLCPFSLLSSSCFHVRLLSSSFYPFFIYFSFLIPHFLPFSCPCLHPSSIASSSPSCLPPCSFEFTLFLTILFYFSSSL